MAMLFGIANFERVGINDVYRYHWQPLAYEALVPFARGLGSGFDLMFVGNIAGALGLTALIAVVARILAPVPRALVLASLLVLCVPELMTTTLYFNSTALALPFFSGALWALHVATQPVVRWPVAALAGALTAAACLLRLDFAVALSFVLALAVVWGGQRWRVVVVAWGLGGAFVALLFLVWRPEFPAGALAIFGKYQAGETPITALYRFRVLVLTLGPALMVYSLVFWGRSRLMRFGRGLGHVVPLGSNLWLALALVPGLLPLGNLYSGKYLVPFLACFLVYAAGLLAQAYRQCRHDRSAWGACMSTPVSVAMAVVMLSMVVGIPSVSLSSPPTWSRVLADPLRAGTHDGERYVGAYLLGAQSIRNGAHRADYMVLFRELAAVVNSCSRDVIVIMPARTLFANRWAWAFLPLYLQREGWRLDALEMLVRAHLAKAGAGHSVAIYGAGRVPSAPVGAVVLDFADVGDVSDADYWKAALLWVRSISQVNHGGTPEGCSGLQALLPPVVAK